MKDLAQFLALKFSLAEPAILAALQEFQSLQQQKEKISIRIQEADLIYEAYPLKVKRPRAIRSIQAALKKESFASLLLKTQQYAKARNGDLSYVPHPSTWFNDEQYNDPPETWTPRHQNGHFLSDLRLKKKILEEKILSLLEDRYINDQWVKRAKPGHELEVKDLRSKLRSIDSQIISS